MDDSQNTTPPPAAPVKATSSSDPDDRYAAYDTTYLRFVGTVHPSKAAAKAAAKADGRDLDALEYRKV